MRHTTLIAGILALATTGVASAAMPYFSSAEQAPAARPASSGWKLPSLWGKSQPAPEPQFFSNQRPTGPTASQRLGKAITDNPVTNTVSGWMNPDSAPQYQIPAQKPDAISLDKPVGKPTPDLLVSLAQMRESNGDVAGARQFYQQALSAAPKNIKSLREAGHFEDRQGQLAEAERLYQQAAAAAPQDAAALNDLALCMARQGKLETSAEFLQHAIRMNPEKPLYRNNMATVLMQKGEQQEAMLHLMAVHPPAVAFFNMGHLLEKGGDLQAAGGHYAEAARLDPTMQTAHEALARVAGSQQPMTPHTAMMPQSPVSPQYIPPTTAPSNSIWPSEPVAPTAPPVRSEPSFGPQLLPPVK